jgi:hypothetical protein
MRKPIINDAWWEKFFNNDWGYIKEIVHGI